MQCQSASVSSGVTNLFDLASDLLDAVKDAFATDGVALPSRQIITTGEPTPEMGQCDTLAVTWTGLINGVPGFAEGPTPVYATNFTSAVYQVWIFRCVSGLDNQGLAMSGLSVSDLQTDATTIMTDAYILRRGIIAAKKKGTFRDTCENLSITSTTALTPQGDVAGTMLELVAELS